MRSTGQEGTRRRCGTSASVSDALRRAAWVTGTAPSQSFRTASRTPHDTPHRHAARSLPKTLESRPYESLSPILGIVALNGQPRAILFDWDNTLVDTWPTILDALNTTFEAFAMPPWSMIEARQRVRKSLRDSFPELFGDRWEEAGEIFYQRYSAIHVEKLRPLAGAERMLGALTDAGIHLGVVSNKKGDLLRRESKHLDWDRYFGALVGALDAEKDKPDPKVIDLALADSGIEKGPDVWFAGDADIDLECAHNAGCLPVLVREQAPGPGEMREHPPVHHFRDCDALCKYIINC